MITDGLSTAFQSERLVYRALENNEEDRQFLHTQIDNDPMNTALFDPRVIQPRSLNHVELLANALTRSTLAVMICLPEGVTAEQGIDKPTDVKPTPIGFVVFGWGGTFPDQAHHRCASMSISLATSYQGQGYGAEAINWALDWAFRFGGYHRVALNTVSFNERAQHLYKRLGFTEEGRSPNVRYFATTLYRASDSLAIGDTDMLPLFSPPRAPAYQYSPIISRPRAFRLVRLLPPHRAVFGDTLRIELITVDDDSACSYDTLSYTWGDTSRSLPNRRVLVESQNGPHELRIYRSLELALLNVKANRPIFVDQICINQEDDEEKASQVALMRDIYTNCNHVLVWLGPETKESNSYFDYIHQVCEEGTIGRAIGPHKAYFPQVFEAVMNPNVQVTGPALEDRDDFLMLVSKYGDSFPLSGIEDVLRRPWFNRLWTIQEVCLAPNVLFICGSRDMCIECFQHGLLYYTVYNTHWVGNVKHAVPQAELDRRQNIFTLNDSPIRMIQERKAIHLRGERRSMYELVIKYNTNGKEAKIGATLAEDRVFGIMGLAEARSLVGMKVRYGDVSGVFTEIAAFLAVHNLDILLFSQFPKRIPNLPSWAPDWTMDLKVPSSYKSLTEPGFSAGGAITAQPTVDLNSGCLVARGVAVGKVAKVGQQRILSDPVHHIGDHVDYRSVKRYFDEIDIFISESRVTKDVDLSVIRLAGLAYSESHFREKYPDNAIEKLKRLKDQTYKWGQRLIKTDETVRSYHLSRIVGTIGILPWYWVPASEVDALQLWATNPIAAFTKWVKAAGFFMSDVVQMSVASARVVLTSKYLIFRRKFARVTLHDAGRDEVLRKVGLDPEVVRAGDLGTYFNDLDKNIGQRLFLTEKGKQETVAGGETWSVLA
ncbi:hypothetical protein G7Z17_g2165 [Cylindrodendrum hubeiense]|uniref:N-acetyltransferase domain-containing protein n=1 Tax=Cylindrodendrum hubeiense TaxID=595255 RepID=A0A9P5LBX9_9HYPO|nr:hypothetical protein G7Z17_g2165 [Cylindrodendrum hubeiense]